MHINRRIMHSHMQYILYGLYLRAPIYCTCDAPYAVVYCRRFVSKKNNHKQSGEINKPRHSIIIFYKWYLSNICKAVGLMTCAPKLVKNLVLCPKYSFHSPNMWAKYLVDPSTKYCNWLGSTWTTSSIKCQRCLEIFDPTRIRFLNFDYTLPILEYKGNVYI